jgi:hypothetical protein
LSQAPKKTKRLGFSLRRRSKPEPPTIDGCEPKVFVDEIEQYLARAAEERRHAASSDHAPVVVEREEIAAPAIAEEQWTAAYSEEEPAVRSSWSAPEPEPEPEPEPVAWRADLLDRPLVEETPIYQPSPVAYEEPAVEYAEEPAVEVAATVEHDCAIQEEAIAAAYEPPPAPVPVEEPVSVEPEMPVAVVGAIAEPTIEDVAEPEISVDAPLTVGPVKPAAAGLDEDKASPSFKAALAAIRAAWGKPASNGKSPVSAAESPAPVLVETQPATAAAETPESVEVDLTDVVEVLDEDPMDLAPRAAEPALQSRVAPVAETVEVYDLSIEPDLSEDDTQLITPVTSQREQSVTKTAAAAPVVDTPKAADSASDAADANGDRRKKSKRAPKNAKAPAPRQEKAAQNEWGVFDPNQCGFAALVDKLDEVADEKTKQPQNGTKTRVIALS